MTQVDRIDGLVDGIAVKAPCKVATTVAITLAGAQTIDGVILTVDADPRQRVLVKDQASGVDNGIYDVNSGAWSRSPDFDGARDAVNGTQVLINEGASPLTKAYYLSATDPVAIGTDSLIFAPTPGYGYTFEDDTTPTLGGNLDMNTFNLEGVSPAEMAHLIGVNSDVQTQIDDVETDVVNLENANKARTKDYAVDAGADDTYVITLSPVPPSWTVGFTFDFEPNTTNEGACTIKPNGLDAKSIKLQNGDDPANNDILAGKIYRLIYDGTNAIMQDSSQFSGQVVQMVYTSDGAVSTGTTLSPDDDTIPLQDEGDEFMTLAITPKLTTNIIKIEVKYNLAASAGNAVICALFQDAISECLVASKLNLAANNLLNPGTMQHIMTAGTTSVITFKFRAGGYTSGTVTFNGESGTRKFGGKLDSSICITEYKA